MVNGIVNRLLVRHLCLGLFNFFFLLLLPLHILADLLLIQTYGTGITSMRPYGLKKPPDQWETTALLAFENNQTEVSSFEYINGQPYMCLMRPLIAEKGCLKCDSAQGYKEGDREPHTRYCKEDGPNSQSWCYSQSPTGNCSTA